MTTSTRIVKIPFKTGTTAQNDAYLGVAGEITIDRTKRSIRVHDGIRRGGEEILRRSDLDEVRTLTAETKASLVEALEAIEYLEDTLPTVMAAAETATAAKTAAETARTGAETARTGAETARTGAETAKTASETAKNLAQDWATKTTLVDGVSKSAKSYASDAAGSASAANTSKINAETARTGAETARTGAETARTGAETAQTAAQDWATKTTLVDGVSKSAKSYAADAATSATAANTAKTSAQDWATKTTLVDGVSKSAKSYAADAAASATAAETAKTGAETARTGAETAKTGAETARTGAETAKTAAETAKTGAETARTLAGDYANKLGAPVTGSDYSAKHWANIAQTAASNASQGQVNPDWNVTDTSLKSYILNKPVIPTNNNQLTNGANYVTAAGARTAISVSGSLSYNNTTGVISYTAPALATVAASGSYNDLTNKPWVPRIFAIGDVGATAGWVKLGVWTAAQTGQMLRLSILSHLGYNASVTQNQESTLILKTGNNGSLDANGFAGDGYWYSQGVVGGSTASPSAIKVVANAAGVAAASYTVYANFGSYNNNAFYSVETGPGASWTDASATGQADPGVASSTVLIPERRLFAVNGQKLLTDGGAANVLDLANASGTKVGNISGDSAILYVQAGSSSTDTTGELRLTRYGTASTNMANFRLFADNSYINGAVTLYGNFNLDATGGERKLRMFTGTNDTGFFKRPSDDVMGMYDWTNVRSVFAYNPANNRVDFGISHVGVGNFSASGNSTFSGSLTMSGGTATLNTRAPGVLAGITGVQSAPIMVPDTFVTKDAASFTPMIHQRTTVNDYGYRSHIAIGAYRTGQAAWNGGMFFALGANDANPTEYFLMHLGGNISHSAGGMFLHSGNYGAYGNMSVNMNVIKPAGTQGSYLITSGTHQAEWFFRDSDKNLGLFVNDGTASATRFRIVGVTGNMSLLETGNGNVFIGSAADDGSSAKLQVGASGISVKASDSGIILQSRNITAAGPQQFKIEHNLGATKINNIRGLLSLQDISGAVVVGATSDDGSGSKLQVAGHARFAGNRPVQINVNDGSVNLKGDAGGWGMGFKFFGSGGTDRGGLFGWGSGDALDRYSIGPTYDTTHFSVYATGGRVMMNASQNYDGYASRLTINYPGGGSEFGITMKPGAPDTNALTFLASGSTYASPVQWAAIRHQTDGMNLKGTWRYEGNEVATKAAAVVIDGGQAIHYTGDLNNLGASGFYRGESMANAPDSGWWYVISEVHNSSWISQTATAFGSGNSVPAGEKLTRVKSNGVWTAWTKTGGNIAQLHAAALSF